MFVFAQVSSMKTSRFGSTLPWRCCHCRRRRATFGRSCSLRAGFFKAEADAVDDVPNGEVADLDAAAVQFGKQRAKRQIRLFSYPFENSIAFASPRKGPTTPIAGAATPPSLDPAATTAAPTIR